jgi:hypothetical protein
MTDSGTHTETLDECQKKGAENSRRSTTPVWYLLWNTHRDARRTSEKGRRKQSQEYHSCVVLQTLEKTGTLDERQKKGQENNRRSITPAWYCRLWNTNRDARRTPEKGRRKRSQECYSCRTGRLGRRWSRLPSVGHGRLLVMVAVC